MARTVIKFVASRMDTHQYINPLVLIPHASIGAQDNSAAFQFPPMPHFSEGDVIGFVHSSDKAAIISASFFGRLENAAPA